MDRDALGGKDESYFETTAHIQKISGEKCARNFLYVSFQKQKKIETLVPAAHKKRRIIQKNNIIIQKTISLYKKQYHYTKN